MVGAAVDRDAGPGTRSEDHAEDDTMAGPRAVGGLGDGEAVGVVGGAHITVEDATEVILDRHVRSARSSWLLSQSGSAGPASRAVPTPTMPVPPTDSSTWATSVAIKSRQPS